MGWTKNPPRLRNLCSERTTSVRKHLFSGNWEINLAISKIQVLAKLAAKGILGNEQTCQCAKASFRLCS
jgi:hypothetical protein